MRKLNGEIRLCVDLRNLNQSYDKDNYTLPSLKEVLQIINSSQMISFLNKYSGNKQVMVKEEDMIMTTFTIKWRIFPMSFGLINISAKFLRKMDIAFWGLVGKCIFIYMEELTVFSKNHANTVGDLHKVLKRFASLSLFFL